MTVAFVPPIRDYVEDGVTLVHSIPFQFGSASEIVCTRIPEGGTESEPLILGTDYNVSGGAGSTGTVTKTSAGTAGQTFRIVRSTTRAQATDFPAHEDFSTTAMDSALDRVAKVDQEQDVALQLLAGRTLRVAEGQTIDPIDPRLFANKFLSIDEDGKLVPAISLDPGFGGTIVSGLNGTDDVARIAAYYDALSPGDTLIFPRGGVSMIDRLLTINAAGIRTIVDGHRFVGTANGAALKFVAPSSPVLMLAEDYVPGSRDLKITHLGNLAWFTRNTQIKIASNAYDGWHRNSGTLSIHYRLAEHAAIRDVVDNGDGTATLKLWYPLRFTRGFANTDDDAELLTEIDTYTVANKTRVVALSAESFLWEGGEIFIDDADEHIGASGWENDGLIQLQGFARPRIDGLKLGPGIGRGMLLSGCVDFEVNSLQVTHLPDNSELSANESITTDYLGYGIMVSGCQGGKIDGLLAKDTRHAVTEGSEAVVDDEMSVERIMQMGRTYGTRIDSPTVEGQFHTGIDTHHGAHAWIISNPVVLGTQQSQALNLRGPDHIVIGGQLMGERGIGVLSELDDKGGSDLGGLNGNGNEWMSSARFIGVNIDSTIWAVSATAARVTIEGGMKIRSRTHNVFLLTGGVIEISSGKSEVEITGERKASEVASPSTTGIWQMGDPDAAYGITWSPEFRICEGASLNVDAAAAVDTVEMAVFHQVGTEAEVNIRGEFNLALPSSGFSSTVFHGTQQPYFTVDRSAIFSITGDATIAAKFPKWDKGRVRIASLAPSVAQTLFTFYDGLGGPSSFVATVKILVVKDDTVSGMPAEYQIMDGTGASSPSERTFLLSGNTADFEANNNSNITVTAPTSGKIGFSYINGPVLIRSEDAGVTYSDVFADFTIYRQPLKA